MARLVKDDTNFGDQAPATEGLIDIRVDGTVALEDLERLSERLGSEFPSERPLLQLVGKLELRPGAPVPLDRGVRGFLRRNDENQTVVQLRRDGFTFSKLKPYTSWEDVSSRARRLWRNYVDLAKPSRITRLAVRYINHIHPPEGWSEASEWLSIYTTAPPIPGAPAHPSDFHIRLLHRHPVAPHIATITVATVSDPGGQRALLLDIDVAHETAGPIDDDTAWSILSELRDFKNDVFFATITSKTRELLSNVANS